MKYLIITVLVLGSLMACAKQKKQDQMQGQTPAETTMTMPPSTTTTTPPSTTGADTMQHAPGDTMGGH